MQQWLLQKGASRLGQGMGIFIIISNSSIILKEISHQHFWNATNSNQYLSTSDTEILWLDFQWMSSWTELHSRSARGGRHRTPTHCSTVMWPTKNKVQSTGFPQLLFREERKLPSIWGTFWSPLGKLCIVVWKKKKALQSVKIVSTSTAVVRFCHQLLQLLREEPSFCFSLHWVLSYVRTT